MYAATTHFRRQWSKAALSGPSVAEPLWRRTRCLCGGGSGVVHTLVEKLGGEAAQSEELPPPPHPHHARGETLWLFVLLEEIWWTIFVKKEEYPKWQVGSDLWEWEPPKICFLGKILNRREGLEGGQSPKLCLERPVFGLDKPTFFLAKIHFLSPKCR